MSDNFSIRGQQKEILLDFTSMDNIQYNEDQLFQRDNYHKIKRLMTDTLLHVKYEDKISDCRIHNAILITGERGSGKTVFMYNLKSEEDKFEFLEMIDPTLLSGTKDSSSCESFCSVLVGLINAHISQRFKTTDKDLSNYYHAFKQVAESLMNLKNSKNEFGLDEIYANQTALQLEQLLHEYFKCVCNLCEKKIIIIRLDDIDMAFKDGFAILETVRKYLASPYVLPIISGAPYLYKHLAEKNFALSLKSPIFCNDLFSPSLRNKRPNEGNLDSESGDDEQYLSLKQLSVRLGEQYLMKVLPFDRQLELTTLEMLLRKYKWVFRFATNEEYFIDDIQNCLDKFFNPGIKQNIYKIHLLDLQENRSYTNENRRQFIKDSARIWVNFLRMMLPIYINFLPKMRKQKEVTPELPLYLEFQERIHNIFSHISDFQVIAEMGNINQIAADSNNFSYRIALEYLSHAKHVKIPQEGKKGFLISLPITNYNKDSKADRATRKVKQLSERECFLLRLFIYSDYPSAGHRKPWLLFAGRFVQFIFATMSPKYWKGNKYDWETGFQENMGILTEPPIFTLFDSTNIPPIPEMAENDEELIADIFHPEKEFDIEKIIGKFQPEKRAYTEDIPFPLIDTHFLYAALTRFYKNLGQYRVKALKEETLRNYFLRCAYMLLNAVGACETEGKVDLENIALSPNISNETIRTNDNAYNINIKPFVDPIFFENKEFKGQNRFTFHLYSHPVIQMILEPEKDHFKNIDGKDCTIAFREEQTQSVNASQELKTKELISHFWESQSIPEAVSNHSSITHDHAWIGKGPDAKNSKADSMESIGALTSRDNNSIHDLHTLREYSTQLPPSERLTKTSGISFTLKIGKASNIDKLIQIILTQQKQDTKILKQYIPSRLNTKRTWSRNFIRLYKKAPLEKKRLILSILGLSEVELMGAVK